VRRRRVVRRLAPLSAVVAGSLLLIGPAQIPSAALASSVSYLYPSFGTNGVAFVTPVGLTSQANAVVPVCVPSAPCAASSISNDVVAVGYEGVSTGGTDAVVGVISPDLGSLVSSFNNGGPSNFDEPSGSTVQFTGVAVYPPCPHPACPWAAEAGDIVAVGTESAAGSTQTSFIVGVYTQFGAEAWTTVFSPTGYTADSAPSVALETSGATPSGDMLLAASVDLVAGGPQTPMLAALTPASGAVDSSFGGAAAGIETGLIEPNGNVPAAESLNGIAVDAAGNIVVSGTFVDPSNASSILVARFLANGDFDPTFGLGPAGCSTATPTPDCTGSTQVGSADLGAGVALESVSGSCTGPAGCYDILASGTGVPTTGSGTSSVVVAAVNQVGATATSFGHGLVTLPSSSSTTGTGIAVQTSGGHTYANQTLGGLVTGVAISGYALGTTSRGVATISRLAPTGSVVSAFGNDGTYVIPSGANVDAQALAVSNIPNTLDFMVVGAIGGTQDLVPRFAAARIVGELVQVTAKVVKWNGHLNADLLTIILTATAPPPETLSVHYTLIAAGGVDFNSSSGTVQIAANRTTGSATVTAYVPPLVSTETALVETSGITGAGLTSVTAPTSLTVAVTSPFGPAPPPGYWMMTTTGGVYSFNVPFKGALTSLPPTPIIGLAESPTGSGYWLATQSGGIYSFGVRFQGALTSKPAAPIVAIASDPATGGYWLFGKNGAVYGFNAPNYGQGTTYHLTNVAAAGAAPNGFGYWLVTSTGSVYAFGPGAKYEGAAHPSAPIVSMAPDPHSAGYWLLASNGSVYAEDAPYLGAATGQDTTCITPDPATSGYWISIANGGVYSFGAKFYGSAAPDHPHGAVVTILGR
jgi:hypothetical protein